MARGSSTRKRQRAAASDSSDGVEEVVPEANSAEPTSTAATSTATTRKKRRNIGSKEVAFNERYEPEKNSSQEILDMQRKKWKSPVYDHFRAPEIVESNDGTVKYRFVCRAHPTVNPVVRTRHDDSTSNLKRHVDACEGKVAPDDAVISSFAHGSTYNKATFRFHVALWLSRSFRPFVLIEDQELRTLFKMLYARVDIPSAKTVSRDIQEIHAISQENVTKILSNYDGRLHLCIDGWTSPNVISFLGVTVHRVEDGKLVSFILDYIKLSSRHTGFYLAEKLRECLKAFGIEKKILAIVADNASNNDVLISHLGECLGGINGVDTQVRCLAHVQNLVLKALISPFKLERKAAAQGKTLSDDDVLTNEAVNENDSEDDNDNTSDSDDSDDGSLDNDDDDSELDADREAFDVRTIEQIIADLEATDSLSPDEERIGRMAVTKASCISALAKRMFHSPTIREDFVTCCEQVAIKPRLMKRSVATRWNSLSQCITRAIYLRPALEKLLTWSKYDRAGTDGFRRYKLTHEEWSILEQLEPILSVFLKATLRISQSNITLLHEVIPIIDVLTAKLEVVIKDEHDRYHQVIRIAALRGREVLNRYYAKTDDSIMYRMAMMLHPRYKKEYFVHQVWKETWKATALNIIREQWTNNYKPVAEAENAAGPLESQASLSSIDIDDFAVIDDWNTGCSNVDPLEEYLAAPVVKTCADPIQYWTSEAAGGNTAQRALARMALDFLSAPATSVDIERGFSRGGLTVSKRRHALSHKSVRAATVLSSWHDVPGLIPEARIIQVFKDKSTRAKGKGKEIDPISIGSDTDTEVN